MNIINFLVTDEEAKEARMLFLRIAFQPSLVFSINQALGKYKTSLKNFLETNALASCSCQQQRIFYHA